MRICFGREFCTRAASGTELLLGSGCELLEVRCRTAHADVHQSVPLHLFTPVEVSSIHYDWITQQLMQPLQIEAGKFIPVGENQQSIRAVGSIVRSLRVCNLTLD